jgi:hypothetical protein
MATETSMRTPEEHELISFEEYCTRFSIPPATARRHVRDVPGLAWKVGTRILIDPTVATEMRRPRPAWREKPTQDAAPAKPKAQPARKSGWPKGRPRKAEPVPMAPAQ